MTFKQGAGDLDFGEEDEEESSGSEDHEVMSGEPEHVGARDDPVSEEPEQTTTKDDSSTSSPSDRFPYLVRRQKTLDEREKRFEVHARAKVMDKETEFRRALKKELGWDGVEKTDAREYGLMFAYNHPEKVADLMREEGAEHINPE